MNESLDRQEEGQNSELTAERLESLKAATLAALSFTLAYSLIAVGNSWLLAQQFEPFAALQIANPVNLILKVAIAFLSGFLFGVTYRYIIRDDENPQLKAGAVLAFGIVRGLAAVEVESDAVWVLSVLGIESILCFAIARLTLDWALHRHWLKPFGS